MLGPKHAYTLDTSINLAYALDESGQAEEAIVMYRENLKVTKEVLGPKHPSTLDTAYNLAVALKTSGQVVEAIVISREKICCPILLNRNEDLR